MILYVLQKAFYHRKGGGFMNSLKSINLFFLSAFLILLISTGEVKGQDITKEEIPAEKEDIIIKQKVESAKVGRFKAGKYFPGHINYVAQKDITWPEKLHYQGTMSLLVGAKTTSNIIKVSSGDGNEMNWRFEWTPKGHTRLNNIRNIPDIDEISQTEYSDEIEFIGHSPLGIDVIQKVYSFNEKNYQILHFEITNISGYLLNDAVMGINSSFSTPNSDNVLFRSNEKLFSIKGIASPLIASEDSDVETDPLLGFVPMDNILQNLNYTMETSKDKNDSEYYQQLTENKTINEKSNPGRYSCIISSVPFNWKSEETVEFSIALIQADGEENFKSALAEAYNIYQEYIYEPKSLAKQTLRPSIPSEFEMLSNYPNPFNPETNIQFSLPENSNVKITLYDRLGSAVATLVNEYYTAGQHSIIWDGRNQNGMQVTSGVYIVKMETDSRILVNKIIFLK